jgi:hypothetical protein
MYIIIEQSTSKVLFAKLDNEVLEGQIAIQKNCTIDNPEQKDIYYNFITEAFYIL